MDDRTILAKTLRGLTQAMACWNEIEGVSRLSTAAHKTQHWARTPDAHAEMLLNRFKPEPSINILGMSFGDTHRDLTKKELDRQSRVSLCSTRLRSLPLSLSFKAKLAAVVMAPIQTWGGLIHSRIPTIKERNTYSKLFRAAVKGTDSGQGDDSDPHLQRVLLLGHHSDLLFMLVQRTLLALNRWVKFAHRFNWTIPSHQTSVLNCLNKALAYLGHPTQPQLGRMALAHWAVEYF